MAGLDPAEAADEDQLVKAEADGALDDSLVSMVGSLDMGERPLPSSAIQVATAAAPSSLSPSGDDLERRLEKRFISMMDVIWQKLLETEERLAATASDLDRLRRTLREGQTSAGQESSVLTGNEQLLKLRRAVEDLEFKHEEMKSSLADRDTAAVVEKLREEMDSTVASLHKESLDLMGDHIESLTQKMHEEIHHSCESASTAATAIAARVAAESAEECTARALDDGLAKLLSEQKSTIESAVSEAAKVVKEAANRGLEDKLASLRAEQQAAVEAAAKSAARATSLAAEEAAAKSQDDALAELRIELDSLHLEQDHRRAEQDQMFERLHSEFVPAAAELAVTRLMDECKTLANRLEPRLEECEQKELQLEQEMKSLESLSSEHGDFASKITKQQEEQRGAYEGLSKMTRAVQQQLHDMEQHTTQELTLFQESLECMAKGTHENELLGQRTAKGLADVQIAVESLQRDAIPRLASQAGALEKQLSEELERFQAANSQNSTQVVAQCNQEVKRLANEVVDRFKEERRRSRDEASTLERRVANASERWQTSWEQRYEAAEQRRTLMEQRHGTQEQRHTLHEQRLAAHDEVLQRLAERCGEIARSLEAQVEAARTAAKDDITASALTAFRGEVALMAKVAQLSNPGTNVQPTTSVPGYVWDGQSWQPTVAQSGHALAALRLPQVT